MKSFENAEPSKIKTVTRWQYQLSKKKNDKCVALNLSCETGSTSLIITIKVINSVPCNYVFYSICAVIAVRHNCFWNIPERCTLSLHVDLILIDVSPIWRVFLLKCCIDWTCKWTMSNWKKKHIDQIICESCIRRWHSIISKKKSVGNLPYFIG